MNNEKVTVSIPTRNSIRTIRETIESVKRQSYDNMEIVLVDSDSKDGTLEYAAKEGIRTIQYPGRTLGAGI